MLTSMPVLLEASSPDVMLPWPSLYEVTYHREGRWHALGNTYLLLGFRLERTQLQGFPSPFFYPSSCGLKMKTLDLSVILFLGFFFLSQIIWWLNPSLTSPSIQWELQRFWKSFLSVSFCLLASLICSGATIKVIFYACLLILLIFFCLFLYYVYECLYVCIWNTWCWADSVSRGWTGYLPTIKILTTSVLHAGLISGQWGKILPTVRANICSSRKL